jgi:hypothetical protein
MTEIICCKMNKATKTLRRVSGAAIGLGMAVQFEKMGLGNVIREQLSPPYNYPFIYGSNFFVTGVGGFVVSGLCDSVFRPVKDSIERTDSKIRRTAAALTSCAIMSVPVAGLISFELRDKCEQYKKDPAEFSEIQACAPDPVDAYLIGLGGILGIGLGLTQTSADILRRREVFTGCGRDGVCGTRLS